MPIYEYQCSKCGHHLEALQKMADPPLRKCPDCGRQALTRLVSAVRFRLTGSGWYETDFKSDQEKKRNLADRGEEAPAEKTSTEKAPAEKTTAEKAKPDTASPAKAESSAKAGTSAAKPAARPVARRKAPARKASTRKPASAGPGRR